DRSTSWTRCGRRRGIPQVRRPRPHRGRSVMRRISLVLVALVASGLVAGCSGAGTYKVTATFDDIGDLQSRASVQTADVRVGTIGKIKLTKDYKARVTMRLRNSVKLPQNSQALLRTTSLLGEKFIEIRPQGDPAQGPYLRNGAVIQ